MQPWHDDGQARFFLGDVRAVLRELEPENFDAIVCDPPYELGFMGKAWDAKGVAYDVDLWRDALRVAKPGAHLVAFGGTRTYHRLACAIEDAGWEIRDSLMWLYGSGFPKSLDVSKAIDRAAGAKREVVGQRDRYRDGHKRQQLGPTGGEFLGLPNGVAPITAPATHAARDWDGWGTALKPAYEPIVLARKPLRGTVAANVTEYGTGGLNIEACRIGTSDGYTENAVTQGVNTSRTSYEHRRESRTFETASGRWPANLVLDEAAAELLDATVGEKGGGFGGNTGKPSYGNYAGLGGELIGYGDSGGPSRFFMIARAQYDVLCEECLGIITTCFVTTADENSNLDDAHPGSVRESAKVEELPEIEGNSHGKNSPALSVETNFKATPATSPSTVPGSAWGSLTEPNAPPAKFADHQCASCGTPIAPVDVGRLTSLAAMIAREVGATCTSGRPLPTPPPGLALSAEHKENTVTIRITTSRKKSCGCATPVTVAFTVNHGALGRITPSDQLRFRYDSKASRSEREAGLEDMPPVRRSDGREKDIENPRLRTNARKNHHPTVKPLDLMRWLVRLVTPPGGLILDPFLGSGTTAIAAKYEGFRCVGIEMEAEYLEIAQRRCAQQGLIFQTDEVAL